MGRSLGGPQSGLDAIAMRRFRPPAENRTLVALPVAPTIFWTHRANPVAPDTAELILLTRTGDQNQHSRQIETT
jgi:hypothetical protein